ncbi:MAG: glycoside hydrolase family 99-like domain-containing protein, partial [Bauldia sp.]
MTERRKGSDRGSARIGREGAIAGRPARPGDGRRPRGAAPSEAARPDFPPPHPAENRAEAPRLDRGELAKLVELGLFDPEWYRRRYRDVAELGVDPVIHYVDAGERENRWPNPHFDPVFYRQVQVAGPVEHPLLHYLAEGERRGLRPVPWFDPAWYRERYLGSFDDINALSHYLLSRSTGRYDPNFAFDTEYYRRENPDVVKAGVDPFEHFLDQGHREDRNPAPWFDVAYYRRRYLHGLDDNPLVHFLEVGKRLNYNPDPNAEPSAATEVRKFSRPAKEFEEFQPEIAAGRDRLAKLIAFYLPQFHPFPENDEWWGTGFTEWTNLSRGNPRFQGHYQPRVPRDFGFYDLRDISVMRRQIDVARAAGLFGFCFYYYNFNGKRLMEGPVDAFLDRPDLDFPFCILWANENWSRRWDGSESEILIRQDYRADDAEALVDDLARHFRDPRYIRLNGRPLFFIYRAGIVPNATETFALWRRLLRERDGEDPLFLMAQTFTDHNPTPFGLDGAVEFPPHKIMADVHPRNPKIEFFDHGFSGWVYQYDDVVEASLGVPQPDFPLIKTAFPSWDNDARRQGRGVVMTGSTPLKYQGWLEQLIAGARRNRIEGEAVVFINAWNEWAEGAYLEPDVHFGSAYLNATARAAVGQRSDEGRARVLLVTAEWGEHDVRRRLGEAAGILTRRFGCEVHLVKLDASPVPRDPGDFASVSTTTKPDDLDALFARLRRSGRPVAFLYGAASGAAARAARRHDIRSLALIGELPIAIRARSDAEPARAIAREADAVVASTAVVLSAFEQTFGPVAGTALVVPPAERPATRPTARARQRLLRLLDLPAGTRLVVNVGPATLQSGADLFAAAARTVAARRDDVVFLWVGDIKPDLRGWLEAGIRNGRLQFRPDSADLANIVAEADLLAFTAREDAEASAVLDAIAADIPMVLFEGSGAGTELVAGRDDARLVPFADVGAFAYQVVGLLERTSGRTVRPPRRMQPDTDGEAARMMRLLSVADPTLQAVTAVILAAVDEPAGLRGRLASVF